MFLCMDLVPQQAADFCRTTKASTLCSAKSCRVIKKATWRTEINVFFIRCPLVNQQHRGTNDK